MQPISVLSCIDIACIVVTIGCAYWQLTRASHKLFINELLAMWQVLHRQGVLAKHCFWVASLEGGTCLTSTSICESSAPSCQLGK